MGKFIFSMIVGALLIVSAGEWSNSDLTVKQVLGSVFATGKTLLPGRL